MDKIIVKSNGIVKAKQSENTRLPYPHQKDAMASLDIINQNESFSTLVVLPTGGGKTYTASMWLLKNALDKKKKILWIAHRQMLLDQALKSFTDYPYAEIIPHISSFTYRIVSGASSHDGTNDIKPTDNLLIVSKDSLGRNIERIDKWIKGEDEIYLIIDEAHHSTAKTYRRIIDYIKSKVKNVKLIGLTATPTRTAENEKGLLSKIYTDGVKNGKILKNDIGITYEIALKELINRHILSVPVFEYRYTEESYGTEFGIDELEHIQLLDIIPENIANQMAESAGRNRLIVDTYLKNQKHYGKTIVFAVNIVHALQLSKLFNESGIKADYIVSDIKDMTTLADICREDNEKKIKGFSEGDTQVLVNVNILTEGVDLPMTQTVFLARPTVSTILMTQMIGRALRGSAAQGTDKAYIVSFIDNWNEHISWVNPESIFGLEDNSFTDNTSEKANRDINLIAISKIEEFAMLLDEMVDTSALEKIPFEKRIPIGKYEFLYLEENGMERLHQVMVYDSTQKAYEELMESIPKLFENVGIKEEYPENSIIESMVTACEENIFTGEMIPAFDREDIAKILRYYAVYDDVPKFYTFDDINRSKLDVAVIARHIYDEDLGPRKKQEYIDTLWNDGDENILRSFFTRKLYFTKAIDLEIYKLSDPDWGKDEENVVYGSKDIEDMSLSELKKFNPALEKELRDKIFNASVDSDGNITCAICGRKEKNRIVYQVDHIVPISKGGKSIESNLQILCRKCNGKKGDKQ